MFQLGIEMSDSENYLASVCITYSLLWINQVDGPIQGCYVIPVGNESRKNDNRTIFNL